MSAPRPRTPSSFENLVDTLRGWGHIPGLAFAAIRDGEIVAAGGSGMADIESARPMTSTSIFNIASITKIMTATAVMQLIENGRLSLEQDVSDFLDFSVRNPAYPETPITVQHLLTHRASLRDNDEYDSFYVCGDDFPAMQVWVRRYFQEPNSPNGPAYEDYMPGTQFEYANIGFALLGVLVERISHKSYTLASWV